MYKAQNNIRRDKKTKPFSVSLLFHWFSVTVVLLTNFILAIIPELL